MFGPRPSRPTCIRAASFRTWQRRARHHLQLNSKRSHVDVAEGFWREVLDPYHGYLEDIPGLRNHGAYRAQGTCRHESRGAPTHGAPAGTLTHEVPEQSSVEDPVQPRALEPTVRGNGWAPVAPEVTDVDMPPVGEVRSPQEAWQPTTQDWRSSRAAAPLVPTEPLDPGRHLQSRAKTARLLRRLSGERDKGPRLVLSKRKLELLLAEPEKTKRQKQ